jgi:hypothetical protein
LNNTDNLGARKCLGLFGLDEEIYDIIVIELREDGLDVVSSPVLELLNDSCGGKFSAPSLALSNLRDPLIL